jgi:hypothetical protein
MTDLQTRRAAMNLAAQLPADPKDRKAIVRYLVELLPFLNGDEQVAHKRPCQHY